MSVIWYTAIMKKCVSCNWAILHGVGKQRILDEIKKCRVLCANCHAVHTAKQFGWYAKYEAAGQATGVHS